MYINIVRCIVPCASVYNIMFTAGWLVKCLLVLVWIIYHCQTTQQPFFYVALLLLLFWPFIFFSVTIV